MKIKKATVVIRRCGAFLLAACLCAGCAPLAGSFSPETPAADIIIAGMTPQNAASPSLTAEAAAAPSPEALPDPLPEVYTHHQLGISITFPATWAGHYIVKERDNGFKVNFLGDSDVGRYGYDFDADKARTEGEMVGTEFFDILADVPAHPVDPDSYDLSLMGVINGATIYYATSTDDALSLLDLEGDALAQADYQKASELKKNVGVVLDSLRAILPDDDDAPLQPVSRQNLPNLGLITDVIPSADGGALLLGNVSSFNTNIHSITDAQAVKLDRDGLREWEYTLSESDYESFTCGTALSDGNFLISYDQGVSLILLNPQGSELWRRSYRDEMGLISAVSAAQDGGAIVTGFRNVAEGGQDGLGMKLDALGNVAWSAAFRDGGDTIFHAACATQDGGAVFAGHTGKYDPRSQRSRSYDGFIVRMDSEGELVWQRKYGGDAADFFLALIEEEDGYLVCGKTRSGNGDPAADSPTMGWIVRLDADGNTIWEKKDKAVLEYVGIAKVDDRRIVAANSAQGATLYALSAEGEELGSRSLDEPTWTMIHGIARSGQRIWVGGGVGYHPAGSYTTASMGWLRAFD